MSPRRPTRTVCKGPVPVGSGHPISVQTMANTRTEDVAATTAQIHELEALGCEIVRVAVLDRAAAKAIAAIRREIRIPLVADIHFSHRLALAAIEAGADAIRINPGNLKKPEHVREVVLAARGRGIPIRIGVNSGSIRPRHGLQVARSGGTGILPVGATGGTPVPPDTDLVPLMVERTMDYVHQFEDLGFRDIVLSLKASDVLSTVAAYRAVAARCDYPLHLGVTAAGPPGIGTIKSALALGILLSEGIGDTIRVSLTGPPHKEVEVAYDILASLGLRERRHPEIISCPTCGRCEIDLPALVEQVEQALRCAPPPLRVAVMGCIVNGPGEAADADIGVAAGKGTGYLFRRGKLLREVRADRLAEELVAEMGACNLLRFVSPDPNGLCKSTSPTDRPSSRRVRR
ncbi:MAG: flavodoxin-dependent (E)-4-hydroxy-3-methylbut-2-enyl-diphosphate synthase [Planctomycetes bacterium]|nr:flavodoxin-dependent (E)-4-hydroxy-3-methylbut-2-enyl-diphosphate synthase [Planctomycetota bacterium]